jgi:predicted acetyltransferase
VETFRRIYEHDPFYSFDLTRVAEYRGELIGYLRAAPREIWVGPGRVRMGGIGEVCTAPEHRRRGIASALLKSMICHMADRGYPVSMLYGRAGFYGRLGWERCMIVHVLSTFPTAIPKCEAPGTIRDLEEDDLPLVMALYDSAYSGRSCAMTRNRTHWQGRILKRSEVKVYDDGEVKGYFAQSLETEGPDDFKKRILRIREAGFRDETSLRGLLSYLREAEVDGIEYPSVPNDRLLEALQLPGSETHVRWDGMFRVNDVAGTLEALAHAFDGFSGKIALIIKDETIPENEGSFLVEGSKGDLSISAGRAPNWVKMDIRAFSQLLPGTFGASQMAGWGLLRYSSKRALALAERLFPRRYPFQPPIDHF